MTDAEGSWKANSDTRTLYICDASSLLNRLDLYFNAYLRESLPCRRDDDGADIVLFDRFIQPQQLFHHGN